MWNAFGVLYFHALVEALVVFSPVFSFWPAWNIYISFSFLPPSIMAGFKYATTS